MATGTPKTSNELAGERTELAGERTGLAIERNIMAANRTLMAWVRTALSLISFGFTIYKFLEAIVKSQGDKLSLMHQQGPQRLGLTLIALGTLAMLMGTIEYFKTIKHLNTMSVKKHKPVDFSVILGMIIGLLGLILFVTIVTNTEVF
jgi:putative membrane protein